MPLLKNAKKKLRQDKKRTARNKEIKLLFKKLIKEAKKAKTADAMNKAFSSIDKAAKHHIVHKNKAGRLKSALTKAVSGEAKAVSAKKAVVKKKTATTKKKTTTKKK